MGALGDECGFFWQDWLAVRRGNENSWPLVQDQRSIGFLELEALPERWQPQGKGVVLQPLLVEPLRDSRRWRQQRGKAHRPNGRRGLVRLHGFSGVRQPRSRDGRRAVLRLGGQLQDHRWRKGACDSLLEDTLGFA